MADAAQATFAGSNWSGRGRLEKSDPLKVLLDLPPRDPQDYGPSVRAHAGYAVRRSSSRMYRIFSIVSG